MSFVSPIYSWRSPKTHSCPLSCVSRLFVVLLGLYLTDEILPCSVFFTFGPAILSSMTKTPSLHFDLFSFGTFTMQREPHTASQLWTPYCKLFASWTWVGDVSKDLENCIRRKCPPCLARCDLWFYPPTPVYFYKCCRRHDETTFVNDWTQPLLWYKYNTDRKF